MRYFYITYEMRNGSEYGYGDLFVSREDFSVRAFKEAARRKLNVPSNRIQINVMEIKEEEFRKNVEDIKIREANDQKEDK